MDEEIVVQTYIAFSKSIQSKCRKFRWNASEGIGKYLRRLVPIKPVLKVLRHMTANLVEHWEPVKENTWNMNCLQTPLYESDHYSDVVHMRQLASNTKVLSIEVRLRSVSLIAWETWLLKLICDCFSYLLYRSTKRPILVSFLEFLLLTKSDFWTAPECPR